MLDEELAIQRHIPMLHLPPKKFGVSLIEDHVSLTGHFDSRIHFNLLSLLGTLHHSYLQSIQQCLLQNKP